MTIAVNPEVWTCTLQPDGKYHSAQPIDTTPPSIPTIGLTAATPSGFTVNLTTASVDVQSGISVYLLEYSTVGNTGPWSTLAQIAPSAFPYTWSVGQSSRQYWVRATAIDGSAAKNPSTPSAVMTITTLPTVSGSAIRFRVGHYLRSGTFMTNGGGASQVTARTAEINATQGKSGVRGFVAQYSWALCEPTQGTVSTDYNWSQIDADIALVASLGGKLIIQPLWTCFFHAAIDTAYIPSYIQSNSSLYGPGSDGVHSGYARLGFPPAAPSEYTAASWRPAVNNRIIQWLQFLLDRLSGNSAFEGIYLPETALGIISGDAGSADFTVAGYKTQLKALVSACVEHSPNSNVWLGTNYLQGSSQDMADLIEYCYLNRAGICWPDTIGNSLYPAQHAYYPAQDIYQQTVTPAVSPSRNYEGLLPCLPSCEGGLQYATSGPSSPYTIADVNARFDSLQATHRIWQYIVGNGGGVSTNGDFVLNLQPYLAAHAVSFTSAPANYAAFGVTTT